MSTRTSAVWRLLRITWPFLAIVLLLVLLARESLEIVSATRAYVGGESLWSKAQKEAVYSLFLYAQSRSEADYLAYREAIAVPMGDRSARLELEKPQPDLARAREGYIAGQNDPDDIAAMIMLFRRFRELPLMNKAIAIWAEGDESIAELDVLAKELHARIAGGETGPDTLAPILARIDNVNRRLTPLEIAFSNTLGEASRQAQVILEGALVLTAALLAIGGIGLTRWMLRSSDALGQALRVSEERFEVAVAGSNAGIWDWNVLSDEVYYSPRYKELLGYSGSEFADDIQSFLDHLHPDERAANIAALTAHLTSGAVYDDEIRLRTRSGEYRWFHVRGKSVRDAEGKAIRMAGSITDITDRKEAEAQLFAERDRAQVTLESIGDAVITTDERGHVDYLNPIAESLTGLPAADTRGLPLERVLRIVRDTDRQVPVNLAATLLREARPLKLAGDTILVRSDGGELAVDASATPIRDRTARIVGAVLVLKDVTRERQFAAQLSHQAQHDALTGLVNRHEFEQRLDRALATAAALGRRHAVLYLDLDHFKEVNDTCGHAAGDKLLLEISGLLQHKLRDRDTLARMGGDEFAVLLEHCAPDDATRIAESLRKGVANFAFAWEKRQFRVGVSIGVVPIAGRHRSVTEVLRIADASCYRAKDAGRDRIHVHDPEDDIERRRG